jgi:hypothetical protein
MTMDRKDPSAAAQRGLTAVLAAAEDAEKGPLHDDPTLRSGLSGLALLQHEAGGARLRMRGQVTDTLRQALAA